jgi:carotenoid cleavage dioxygenase
MQSTRPLPDWLARAENPYLEGLFAPVFEESEAADLPVTGELPRDLDGVFLRNGPNPVYAPRGRYHWFDGDGMVHAVSFRDGRASYRNRWVRTQGLSAERDAGRALWPGYLEKPDPDAPPGSGSDGWLKDSANTDLVFHNGAVLALWYQCGLPYRLDPRTLATLGPESFGGRLERRVSAHAKVDAATGELLFFDYATKPPFLTHHVVSARGELVRSTEIELPGPRLPHDMAFTARHSILMDLPLFWDPELLERRVHRLGFHHDLPSRFALLPRAGGPVRWFEAEPTYIYHVVNAWEDGDEVVMDACRVVDPGARPRTDGGPLARMLATLRLEARLHRYRFDLRTGDTREEDLDDQNTEFPSIDARRMGTRTRYAYIPHIAPDKPTLLFDALVKYDTASGKTETHAFGPGRYCSESPFAPRVGGQAEDDGFVVCFVHDEGGGDSEAHVLDARDFSGGPLAIVSLPRRVPVGFHACWVDGTQLPGSADTARA